MALVTLTAKLTNTTACLVYLAEVYHLDLATLLFLYEKYEDELFYFFFLFGGRSVSFPKTTKFLKILQSCRQMVDNGAEFSPSSKQEERVFEKILEVTKGEQIEVEINVTETDDDEQ